jgi:hypothetical protein
MKFALVLCAIGVHTRIPDAPAVVGLGIAHTWCRCVRCGGRWVREVSSRDSGFGFNSRWIRIK